MAATGFALSLINLIPVGPLDGARVVPAVRWPTFAVIAAGIGAVYLGAGRLNFVSNYGSRKAVIDDIQIRDNVLIGKAMKMYFRGGGSGNGIRRGHLAVTGNQSDQAFGSGRGVIEVTNFDGVTVYGNKQPFKTVRHGNNRGS